MRRIGQSALIAGILATVGACEHATGPQRMHTHPELAQVQSVVLPEEKLVHLLKGSPADWALTPFQQRLLMRPVSPEAAAGRPATRADLEAVRDWFGPGELEAILAVVNRGARARGADTLPHCLPLCDQVSE
jgi:hypothetical protein